MRIGSPADFGKAVRTARLVAGIQQRALAAAAGVGERFVVDLEAGKPTIHLGKALEVIAALDHRLSIGPQP